MENVLQWAFVVIPSLAVFSIGTFFGVIQLYNFAGHGPDFFSAILLLVYLLPVWFLVVLITYSLVAKIFAFTEKQRRKIMQVLALIGVIILVVIQLSKFF